ncbi:hypothetical protein [Syntrophotalea acetylenica]|uniref:hypothetical protein n=1 Tax=Syntrophotalea acetylenica TaxID=29542 RepID=UPI00387E1592
MAQPSWGKGFKTEELLRAYFLRAGFFVVRGIKLKIKDTELTDSDLLVYERSATLARRRTVIDVKDKKSPQAAERLFFVSGLAQILGVEGAGVATTDKNPILRELARKSKILWIDGDDLQRLKKSDKVLYPNRLSEEEMFDKIDQLDKLRGGRKYRVLTEDIKSSIGDRFGVSSANRAIEAFQVFVDEAIKSHPKSVSAEVLSRLAYFSCSLAAASLDFASADSALRPTEERCKLMSNAIRYGENAQDTFQKLEWTELALREYIENGASIAREIKDKFTTDAGSFPSEDLAEIVIKLSNTNKLFEVARSLETAAFRVYPVCFDDLATDAKSFVGAMLDFCSLDRRHFSDAMSKAKEVSEKETTTASEEECPVQGKLL